MNNKKKNKIVPMTKIVYYYKVEMNTTVIKEENRKRDDPYSWSETWSRKTLIPVSYLLDARKEDISDVHYYPEHEVKSYTKMDQGNTAAWLVWVEYSSGSTFGTNHSGRHAPIFLFPMNEYHTAVELKEYILDNKMLGSKKFDYKTNDPIYIYPQWTGYFDTLEDVHISMVNIVPNE
jgi:hypothetical protein